MAIFMRLVSLFLIVVALMLLGADAVASLEKDGEITVRSLETVWAILDNDGLTHFKDWLQHYLPFLAQGVYSSLALPGWALTGVVGVIVAFIFGRKLGPE